MATITFKNVVKAYDKGAKPVIPDLSFEIKDKEFVILVGPSGCGKSTTLRMIAGLEEITAGELYIDDLLVNDIAPKDRDIAMVFQSYALYPHLSVYKNIAFALRMRHETKEVIDEKVKAVAEILDLTPYLNRKPRALSGGQRQRVALGRAMVRNPKVFLLDEPLSNLDAKLRTEMRSEITKLHKELQTTFVYVTHDQTEAMTMADRIVVLKDGVIQQYDTPQNLFERPVNLFVAGFIGSPQMNFINGFLIKKNNQIVFTFDEYKIVVPKAKNKGKVLDKYIGKEVILGIRPDDIYYSNKASEDIVGTKMTIKADIAELMGSEIYVYFYIGERKLVAKIPSITHVKMDDMVDIILDSNNIHLFDKESEIAICN